MDIVAENLPSPKSLDWELYDPPRQYLVFLSGERTPISPSIWTNTIAPRWRTQLFDMITSFYSVPSSVNVCTNNHTPINSELSAEQLTKPSIRSIDQETDLLVLGLNEFFNGILFRRVTSHQAAEMMKQIIEKCYEKLLTVNSVSIHGSRQYLHNSTQDVKESKCIGIDKKQKLCCNIDQHDTIVQSNETISMTYCGSTFGTYPPITAIQIVTPLTVAVLDSLRWCIEYALGISERLLHRKTLVTSLSTNGLRGKTNNTIVSPTTRDKTTRDMNTSQQEPLRAHQRILSLLDAIEKSGLLKRADIIANIPYTQLDAISYCTTKERLSLMKLNVRLRTKEIFTLPVYNIEGENPVGFTRLHILLQQAMSKGIDPSDSSNGVCSCWTDTYLSQPTSSLSIDSLACPVLNQLMSNINHLIVEFRLCINRTVQIMILYLSHFLFVLKHNFIEVIFCLSSKNKLEELILFQIRSFEDALAEGSVRSRRTDIVSSSGFPVYPPSQHFFQFCAYLVMEGVITLDVIWNNIGPSEDILSQLSNICNGTVNHTEDVSSSLSVEHSTTVEPTTAQPSTNQDWVLRMTKDMDPDQIMSFLYSEPLGKFSLISALIDLNGWSYVIILLERMGHLFPLWSIHHSHQIITSFGSYLSWLTQPLILKSSWSLPINKLRIKNAEMNYSSKPNRTQAQKRSSAIGAYPSPYFYGLHIKSTMQNFKRIGLTPVDTVDTFDSTVIPLLKYLGVTIGTLPSSILELIIISLGVVIKKRVSVLSLEDNESSLLDMIPQEYIDMIGRVIFPAMCISEPQIGLNDKLWDILKHFPVRERFTIYSDFFHVIRHLCPKVITSSQSIRRTVGRELKRVTAEQSITRGPGTLFSSQSGGDSVMGDLVVKAKSQMTHRERGVMDALLKMCCINPFEVMDAILHQVEIFDSMLIRVIINYLPSLPILCSDIAVFLVTERQQSLQIFDRGIWSLNGSKPKKLKNMAHFSARFLRRFSEIDVQPLVVSVASRIVQETQELTYPDRLTGKYCDVVYLEELITWMGGVPKLFTEELSVDQVECAGAGPNLRLMILVDDDRREELYRPGNLSARNGLKKALLDGHVFRSIILGLSKLKLEIQYDCQLLCDAKSLQLRSIASLTDDIQLALLQLIEFVLLPDNNLKLLSSPIPGIEALYKDCSEFAVVLPAIWDSIRFCEPAMIWHLIRGTLSPLYLESSQDVIPTPEHLKQLQTPGFYPFTTAHLNLLANKFFPDAPLGVQQLYVIFWRLDLQDIWTPEDVYLKHIQLIVADLQHIATERQKGTLRRSSADEATVQKELDVMVSRLTEWKKTFEAELAILKKHKEDVLLTLKATKHKWFQNDNAGPTALTAFIQHMIGPRLLSSQKDALYCTKFIQLLVDLDTEGFYLIDFFNKWTGMLTPLVRSCSIQEADYLGLFVNEMAAMINRWVRDPTVLQQYAKDNRSCYSRLVFRKSSSLIIGNDIQLPQTVTLPSNASPAKDVDMVINPTIGCSKTDLSPVTIDSSELIKIIGKWENRIFRVIQHGLSLTEKETSWMAQRVVIKFLNKTHQNFPITDVAGTQILRSLPALIERAKDSRWDDVVANAKALDRNLRVVEASWLKRKEDEEDDTRKRAASCQDIKMDTPHLQPIKKYSTNDDRVLSSIVETSSKSSTQPELPQSQSPVVTKHIVIQQPKTKNTEIVPLIVTPPIVSIPSQSMSSSSTFGPKNPFHASPKVSSTTVQSGIQSRTQSQTVPNTIISQRVPTHQLMVSVLPDTLCKLGSNHLNEESSSSSSISSKRQFDSFIDTTSSIMSQSSNNVKRQRIIDSIKDDSSIQNDSSIMLLNDEIKKDNEHETLITILPTTVTSVHSTLSHQTDESNVIESIPLPEVPMLDINTPSSNETFSRIKEKVLDKTSPEVSVSLRAVPNTHDDNIQSLNTTLIETIPFPEECHKLNQSYTSLCQTDIPMIHSLSDTHDTPEDNELSCDSSSPTISNDLSRGILESSSGDLISEGCKFEKQKEIDALRQRIKSLHTHRSKSSSNVQSVPKTNEIDPATPIVNQRWSSPEIHPKQDASNDQQELPSYSSSHLSTSHRISDEQTNKNNNISNKDPSHTLHISRRDIQRDQSRESNFSSRHPRHRESSSSSSSIHHDITGLQKDTSRFLLQETFHLNKQQHKESNFSQIPRPMSSALSVSNSKYNDFSSSKSSSHHPTLRGTTPIPSLHTPVSSSSSSFNLPHSSLIHSTTRHYKHQIPREHHPTSSDHLINCLSSNDHGTDKRQLSPTRQRRHATLPSNIIDSRTITNQSSRPSNSHTESRRHSQYVISSDHDESHRNITSRSLGSDNHWGGGNTRRIGTGHWQNTSRVPIDPFTTYSNERSTNYTRSRSRSHSNINTRRNNLTTTDYHVRHSQTLYKHDGHHYDTRNHNTPRSIHIMSGTTPPYSQLKRH